MRNEERLGKVGVGVVLVAGLAVVGTACGGDEITCPEGTLRCLNACIDEPVPTMAYLQRWVFGPTCDVQLCHGAVATQEELMLTDEQTSFDSLVDQESVQRDDAILVVPGDSGSSYLMNKITGVDMEARSSINEPTFQMPRAGGLCQEQIDVVRQWIDNGAPRN